MHNRDLLFELGTEELPAKSLLAIANALADKIKLGLKKAELNYGQVHIFATPRRLGVLIKHIPTIQNKRLIEKRGPALSAAFDTEGNPTLACLGFANTCNTTVDQLIVRKTDKGAWLFFSQEQEGATTVDLLPDLLQQAILQLPIAKPMRWGEGSYEFIRPVHWVLLLFGETVIKTTLLGQVTGGYTYGHRFHHPEKIAITHPNEYEMLLRTTGYVIADFQLRRHIIEVAIQEAAIGKGQVIINKALLDEVTGLVEWPIALLGEFQASFLDIPTEVIQMGMQHHQKYFPLQNTEGKLLPYFVLVSNIQSRSPEKVVLGNQRVIQARLFDAQFFYQVDLTQHLALQAKQLKKIIFQDKLGTLFDKTERLVGLCTYLADQLQTNIQQAQRAAYLSKMDLVSKMVLEFGELQGIMGYYYALKDGEPLAVAMALKEYYQPRFSGDKVPQTLLGALLSIADKIDTLVGLFGTDQPPNGEKDPYGLRRAAMGIIRTLIEQKLPIDIWALIQQAVNGYTIKLSNPSVVQAVFDFMMDRLQTWYVDKQIEPSLFAAVAICDITCPMDFHERIIAVQQFLTLPEAQALITANKRVSRLLKDPTVQTACYQDHINPSLLQAGPEQDLFYALKEKSKETAIAYQQGHYHQVLTLLTALQNPIDRFFEHVMVMVENLEIRNNRLTLLYKLQQLFLQVADISVLSPMGLSPKTK